MPESALNKTFGDNSTQIYTSLVRLNYIDKDGFVTEEFNGDLKWLDEEYKIFAPKIINNLY